jgi:hypothetical protein
MSKNGSGSTVAGNSRAGADKANNATMPQGKKASTMQGSRAGYLGAGIGPGYAQVSAGTAGPNNGSSGVNGGVTSSKASMPGCDASVMLSPSGKTMREGKKPSTTAGLHKGYL